MCNQAKNYMNEYNNHKKRTLIGQQKKLFENIIIYVYDRT